MSSQYYTRATKLAGLEQIARACGGDLAGLMRKAGLDPAALRKPEQIIGYSEFCALLGLCARDWDMPDIGLRMIEYQQIDFLGPVALVTRMEGTVRGAVQAIIANLVIHSNVTLAALEESGDTATLILNQRSDVPSLPENAELVLAQGKLVLDTIVQGPVPLIQISLMHQRGRSARALAAHFGCPVRYGADRNALSFDSALLDRKIERSDKAYHALILRYLDTARTEIDSGLSDTVRTDIARQMELGHCTLESVAMAQRMAPHTLQRRLKSEGTSFRQLMEDWRRARALSLVTNTRLPLAHVAEALGYSDQSVFSQAFRRWYGEPPKRYRTAAAGH